MSFLSLIDEFSKELQKEYEARVKATKMITDLQKDKSKFLFINFFFRQKSNQSVG